MLLLFLLLLKTASVLPSRSELHLESWMTESSQLGGLCDVLLSFHHPLESEFKLFGCPFLKRTSPYPPSAERMSLLEKLWSQLTSSVTLESKHSLFLSSILPPKPGQSDRAPWRVTSNEDPSKGWDQHFVHYPVKILVPRSLPSSHGGK